MTHRSYFVTETADLRPGSGVSGVNGSGSPLPSVPEVPGDGRAGAGPAEDCMDALLVRVPEAALPDAPEDCLDVEQVPHALRAKALAEGNSVIGLLVYGLLGLLFGIVLVKSEVVSWFRIQEMFRFGSIHMYGIIGAALVTAAAGMALIKSRRLKTLHGEPIVVPPKEWGRGVRYWAGGLLFGFGWALLGACPGPMFALIGGGFTVMLVALAGALAGTFAYGLLRPHLAH